MYFWKFVLRLTALCVGQVKDNKIAGVNASISALEFFSTSLTLAIGNDFGLVRIRTVSVFRFPWNNENSVTWQLHCTAWNFAGFPVQV